LTSMTTSWSPKRTHRTESAACWQLGMWRPPNTTAPAEIWSSYGATGAQKSANVPRPLPAKTAKTSQKTVANRCAYLRFGPHGKEGVGGSSPPEGSASKKVPANRQVLLSRAIPQHFPVIDRTAVSTSQSPTKCLQIRMLSETMEHLLGTDGMAGRAAEKGRSEPLEQAQLQHPAGGGRWSATPWG
jgi:hypothetical protein